MSVTDLMLSRIAAKHGPAMNEFWMEEFGYGLEHLTQGEAGHVRAADSVDALRDRIDTARNAAIRRLDEGLAREQSPGPKDFGVESSRSKCCGCVMTASTACTLSLRNKTPYPSWRLANC